MKESRITITESDIVAAHGDLPAGKIKTSITSESTLLDAFAMEIETTS